MVARQHAAVDIGVKASVALERLDAKNIGSQLVGGDGQPQRVARQGPHLGRDQFGHHEVFELLGGDLLLVFPVEVLRLPVGPLIVITRYLHVADGGDLIPLHFPVAKPPHADHKGDNDDPHDADQNPGIFQTAFPYEPNHASSPLRFPSRHPKL